MLQGRAQAQFSQSSPHHELRHACVLLRKFWEFVSIQWELCLLAFDDFLVFKEQNSAHTSGETAINFAFSLGKLFSRNHRAQRVFHNIPQFLMLFTKQHHHTRRLGMEG